MVRVDEAARLLELELNVFGLSSNSCLFFLIARWASYHVKEEIYRACV